MLAPKFQVKVTPQEGFTRLMIEPLEKGYGQTLGNALRRVMLTSITGAAITQVKINGVKHKFSTLAGMKEDVIELILTLKEVRLKYDGKEPVKMRLDKTGPGKVTAADFEKTAGVTIINKELVLANLADKKSSLTLEVVVESGSGYHLVDESTSEELGVIPLDAAFGPVKRVDYRIEAMRVGRRTDLDRLVMDMQTDGSKTPEAILKEAAQILVAFFQQVVEPSGEELEERTMPRENQAFKLTVEELDYPVRIANALRHGGYQTVADLALATKADLLKVKNLGEKSTEIVLEVLAKKGIKIEETAK